MRADLPILAVIACALAAMLALGAYVSNRPLIPLDVVSIRLRGHGQKLAVAFTRSGYWPELMALSVLAAVAEFALRHEIAFAGTLALAQLVSQQTAHFLKLALGRIRPDDWLYRNERGGSYPSGHACTAVVFYGGLALFVPYLGAPPVLSAVLGSVLVAWGAGIAWARMALAAHYATDVLGGLLFGCTWLGIFILVIQQI